ncbi:MAG: PHP domain-containing protein [Actinobacteria bacterium]|nr:PHP domain-containing protein [Actinomycetota bacterium]
MTLTFGAPGPAFTPEPAPTMVNDTPGWYRGDLHLHTVHSDGSYTPEEIVAGADAAGLDYFVSTEHNTPTANSIWGRHARPDLLIVGGEEATTRGGHYNAVGLDPGHWIDWRYRPEDNKLPRFLNEIHGDRGIAVLNHPFCPFKGCDWRFPYEVMDGIEVWNGPWDPSDEAAVAKWDELLRAETFLPAVGASDAHRSPNVIGLPQTVVRAQGLNQGKIIKGVAGGHSYIVESSGQTLQLTAQSGSKRAGIGGRLVGGGSVVVRLRVQGAPGTVAALHTGDGLTAVEPIETNDATVTWTTTAAATRFVRAEVRSPDSTMVGLTNPIFLVP